MGFLDKLPLEVMQWFRDLLNGFLPIWGTEVVVALVKVIIAVLLAIMPVIAFTWLERKVLARTQDRYGPNVAGPFGLIVAFADAIKILTKEDITPSSADKTVFRLAPAAVIIPPLLLFAVIPFGRGMAAADFNVGILYVVAMGSITVLAVLAASWSSGNKYSMLATFRAVAQLVSYEIPMAFAILAVVLVSGSLSTVRIVEAQALPFAVTMPIAAATYFLCALAEANRSPFDLLEAESELIAGFNIEYSGMRFAMVYIAEYAHIFLIGAFTTTLFLGGYQGPILPGWMWFFIKSVFMVFVVLWIRATWPRMRIDHLLNFSWKFLLPLAMANLLAVAFIYKLVASPLLAGVITLAANLVLLAVAALVLRAAARRSPSRALRAIVLGEVAG